MLERTYIVPLRKTFSNGPRWKKTKRAVSCLRDFAKRHMKSEKVLISKEVNEELWKNGLQNPPGKIKVIMKKDDEGIVSVLPLHKKEKKTEKPTKEKEKKTAEKEEKPKKEKKGESK